LLRGKRANGEHSYSLWIEDSPQFTAESFNGYYGAGDGILFGCGILKKNLQRVPGAAAEIGKQFPV